MDDNFSNPAVIWCIVGLILFLLEFVVPGLVLVFFGLGAWLVSAVYLATGMSINYQLLLFLFSSVIFILLLRNRVRKKFGIETDHSHEIIESEFIGKTGKAETNITPGEKGKIAFKGTTWDAVSEDIIHAGENVTIIGNDSITLKVKSHKL